MEDHSAHERIAPAKPVPAPRLTRRRLLIGGVATIVAGVATTPYTFTAHVTRRTLHLPNLPREWDGVTALHLSDFHRGPLVPAAYIRGVLERARALHHDIAFFTGDFVSWSISYMDDMRNWLKAWPAPLGSYAVLGNHDHYTDAPAVARALEGIGIPVLNNRSVIAHRGNSPIRIVGVDDPATSQSDFRGAVKGVEQGVFRLLLAHSPDIVWSFGEREIDLALCGHTHGGQVCLPGGQALVCPINLGTDYAQGIFYWRKATLFVNRGIGVVGVPIRAFCPPEIAVLTLKRGNQP